MSKVFLLLLACISPNEDVLTERKHRTPIAVVVEENTEMFSPWEFISSPVRKAAWTNLPDVVICQELMLGKGRVNEALNFWESRGHTFGEVYEVRCDKLAIKQGAIYFMNPETGYDFKHLSMTRTTYAIHANGDKEITTAFISVTYPAKHAERILEHEIGHALGYQHTHRRGHLMNPRAEMGGYGDFGLRAE